MTNAFVFDVSMEAGLEFMTIVGAYLLDSERNSFDCEANKIDGSRLRMTHIDLQGPDPGCIIGGELLEAAEYWKRRTVSPFSPASVSNLTSTWI